MAIATGTAIALGALAIGGAAMGTAAIAAKSAEKQAAAAGNQNQNQPAVQSIQETEAESRRRANLMRSQQTSTILTSPLEGKTEASTAKPKLGA